MEDESNVIVARGNVPVGNEKTTESKVWLLVAWLFKKVRFILVLPVFEHPIKALSVESKKVKL
tara:strand:- start:31 stop:219 length:189 start_codon:yes stop_codon:yes gene_type:complete